MRDIRLKVTGSNYFHNYCEPVRPKNNFGGSLKTSFGEFFIRPVPRFEEFPSL
jgi:hypothetical protein